MSLGTAIAGGIALKLIHEAVSDTEANHDDVLEKAYRNLDQAVAAETDLYVDHIQDRRGVNPTGNPKGELPDATHVPDLMVKGFEDSNLVIEVETGDTLNQTAVEQLEDFSTAGYKRVLVVPDGTLEDGIHFVDNSFDKTVYAAGPSELPKFL